MISHRPQQKAHSGTRHANSSLAHRFRRKMNRNKLALAQKQRIYKLFCYRGLYDECLHLSDRGANGVITKTSLSIHEGQRRGNVD